MNAIYPPPTLPPKAKPASAARLSRGPVLFGSAIALVFFGIFGSWAALAPLSSGAIASGVVSPDSSRRVIQHLEGGRIQTINVREGQVVAKGDLLMILDKTSAQAQYTALRAQWLRLQAISARIRAQQLTSDAIEFSPEVLAVTAPAFVEFVTNQQQTFLIRRTTLEQQLSIFDRQIEQLGSQISAMQAESVGLQTQIDLIGAEIADKVSLVDQQLLARSALLTLQREQASLVSAIAGNGARIAQAGQSIEEIRLSALQARETYRNEVADESTQINNELAQVEENLTRALDILERTDIVAPVDGIVLGMRFKTEGGVITPGSPILDIVPADDDLVIVARLNPQDIEAVSVGLLAHVTLTPFASRNMLPLTGEVMQIDADSTPDERSGMAFYQMRVEVSAEEMAKHPGIYLSPGMPADVTVVVGERTMLQYLIGPFIRSLESAFVHD